jgi:hypothetical protein
LSLPNFGFSFLGVMTFGGLAGLREALSKSGHAAFLKLENEPKMFST